jgi:hypothetical protein
MRISKVIAAKAFLDMALNDAYRAGVAAVEGGLYPNEEQQLTTDDIFEQLIEILEVEV